MENLAELPDYAMPLARMQAALSAWRTETNDPLLTAEGWARVARYERVSPGGGK
jgi:hypothetical protein